MTMERSQADTSCAQLHVQWEGEGGEGGGGERDEVEEGEGG